MTRSWATGVMAIAALFFAAFFAWPILQILRGGFVDPNGRFTFAFVRALLADPIYSEAMARSLWLAFVSTAFSAALALPIAFLADRYDFPGKRLLGSLILVPMFLPPFVGAIGLRQIFGRCGAANALIVAAGLRPRGWGFDWLATDRFWAVALIEGLSLFPIIYLNAVAALANVDPSMEEAAESLGSSGWRRFRRITLPLIQPGLFAGGTIVFISAFTDLGVPLMLDYPDVMSVKIYDGLREMGSSPIPYALATVMLAGSALLYVAGRAVFRSGGHEMMARATAVRSAVRLPPVRAWLCTGACALILFAALLPHLGVVGVAFSRDWYATVLPHPLTLDNFRMALSQGLAVPAIENSLRYAGCAAALDLILGVAIAHVVVRSGFPGRNLLDLAAMMPLAVPGLVLAFGYLAMTQPGRIFSFLDPVANPAVLLTVAYAMRRLPYVVRSAAAGFQQTSPTLEEAARSLGCPPLKAAIRITLPLIAANLIAGGVLAFAFAMLEVSDSLILAQKQAFYPITKAILELFQLIGDGKFMASALGVWAMAFLAVSMGGLGLLLGRKLGALFRA